MYFIADAVGAINVFKTLTIPAEAAEVEAREPHQYEPWPDMPSDGLDGLKKGDVIVCQ